MPIYFLFDFKSGDMAAIIICFLTPIITLFCPISGKLCNIGY